MKLLRSFLMVLALGVSASNAQARDSFHLGINIGGYAPYGYPVVAYHAAPPVVYHHVPRIYHPAPVIVHRDVYYGGPRYYHPAPRHHGFQGYHGGHRHFNRGHGHHRGHR